MKKPQDNDETSETDWERLDSMCDEDIDFSDISEITPEMFARRRSTGVEGNADPVDPT